MSLSSGRRAARARPARLAPVLTLLALVLGLLAAPAAVAGARAATPRAAATGQQTPVHDVVAWMQRRVGDRDLVTAPSRQVRVKVEGPHRTRWVRRTVEGPAFPSLSIDVLLALRRLDGGGATQARMARALQGSADDYVHYRIGALEGRYALATARMVQVAAVSGIPMRTYADGSLRRSLAAMVRKSPGDPQRGRVVDSGWGGDRSNTLSQAAAVQALAALDAKNLPVAARFLAKQSCEAGHFRRFVDSPDYTCQGSREPRNRSASLEATAAAVLALRTARSHGVRRLDDEISAGSRWLARHVADNGRVAQSHVVDARTTALVALALKATGRRGAAGNAAAWLLRHQVDHAMIRRHPALRGQLGAIALNSRVLHAAQRHGVSRRDRKLWLQSTAGAAPGLVALLPAKQLTVRTATRGRALVVRISGLVAGERYVLKREGRVVSAGRATSDGHVRVVLRAPRHRVRLAVFGNRVVRSGVSVVSHR